MTWIDFADIQSSHYDYLHSVARALTIAQHFERACRYVLSVSEVDLLEGDKLGDSDVVRDLFTSMCRHHLGKMVWRMKHPALGFREEELEILEKGREARNYIAHESASDIEVYVETDAELLERLNVYSNHVRLLIAADNEVSAWEYEICERQSRPGYYERYPKIAFDWVTAPLIKSGMLVSK